MKLALLSNININLLIERLTETFEVYKPCGYNTYMQELLDTSSDLYAFKPDIVFLILDGEELFKGTTDLISIKKDIEVNIGLIENIVQNHKNIMFFVSNLDFQLRSLQSMKQIRNERLVEGLWYDRLCTLNEKFSSFFIFDLKKLVEVAGRSLFYSAKLWYLSSSRFSAKAEKLVAKEITRISDAVLGKRKKCLVLDLDNTLWGGVVGEDGLEGIELSEYKEGARFKDFQKRLKEIRKTGIILVISSKNNIDDAMAVFKNHPQMVLQEDDFAEMKINWDAKTGNILQISKDLNIGMDSMVFIDDNPSEREEVKTSLPLVEVPDFPGDTTTLDEFISEIYYDRFLCLTLTEEDRCKTEMYRQNLARKSDAPNDLTLDDYLNSLKTIVDIWQAKPEDVERIAQLTQKTNQFNVTSKRYTVSDIQDFINSKDHYVFVASVKDKFGDNGKTVLAIVKRISADTAEIDTFLMSCRVMGRFIEDRVITFVEDYLYREGCRNIIAFYHPTSKNIPVNSLFDRLGYTCTESLEDGKKIYINNLIPAKCGERKLIGELKNL